MFFSRILGTGVLLMGASVGVYGYSLSTETLVRVQGVHRATTVTEDSSLTHTHAQWYAQSSPSSRQEASIDPYQVQAGDTTRIETLELEQIPFALRKNQNLYRSHLQMLRSIIHNTVRANESGEMLPYEFGTIENEIVYLFSEIDSYHTYLYMVEVYPSKDNLTLLRNQKALVRQSIERLQIASSDHIIIPNSLISYDFR